MSEASWRFRTAKGTVTVRRDAIRIRSPPGQFLAGQRSRWRHADRRERGAMLFRIGGLLASLAGLAYKFPPATGGVLEPTTLSFATTLAFFGYAIWSNHVGETRIPLSAVESVTLDEAAGTLTIAHGPGDGLLAPLRDDDSTTELVLPAATDVREAREIFRLRGIDVQAPGEGGTGTTFRMVVRDGACFCERCDRQVSPADRTCPACGYVLQVRGSHAEGVGEASRSASEAGRRTADREVVAESSASTTGSDSGN